MGYLCNRTIRFFLFLLCLWGWLESSTRNNNSAHDSPLLYALLKQRLECKAPKNTKWSGMLRHVCAISLAVGCGVVGGATLDYYLFSDINNGSVSKKKRFFGWCLDHFGSVVEKTVEVGRMGSIGASASAGFRIRTPEELKGMAINAAKKTQEMMEKAPPETVQKSMFKPLFCISTMCSYFLCRYLLRERQMPFYSTLKTFVVDWEMHKKRTPKEFHVFFQKLYESYEQNGELEMNEEVAMTLVRQLSMVCSSRIFDELGISDIDANQFNNNYLVEVVKQEEESMWFGWQFLPVLCKVFTYFFMG